MRKFAVLASAMNNFGKAIKELFAKKEPEKDSVIAQIAPKKVVIKVGDSAHISGITEVKFKDLEVVDAANWERETYSTYSDEWERQIRKPNRINKNLSYRKKKSQAKNWDKWKRKGNN